MIFYSISSQKVWTSHALKQEYGSMYITIYLFRQFIINLHMTCSDYDCIMFHSIIPFSKVSQCIWIVAKLISLWDSSCRVDNIFKIVLSISLLSRWWSWRLSFWVEMVSSAKEGYLFFVDIIICERKMIISTSMSKIYMYRTMLFCKFMVTFLINPFWATANVKIQLVPCHLNNKHNIQHISIST